MNWIFKLLITMMIIVVVGYVATNYLGWYGI